MFETLEETTIEDIQSEADQAASRWHQDLGTTRLIKSMIHRAYILGQIDSSAR